MKRGAGARSGSRPRRRFRARRNRACLCSTWWPRPGADGAGRRPARPRCAACTRRRRRQAGGRRLPRRSRFFRWSAGSGMVAFSPAPSQPGADRGAGVGLVGQDPPGPGPGAPRAPPGDLQPVQQRAEGQAVVALPGAGQPGQRPAPGVGQQVDLAGQPAPRPAQRLAILVIRLSPLCGPGRSAPPGPAAPDRYQPAGHAGRPPRAGAPAPPWRPRQPSTPGLRPHRTQRAAGPGSSPRSRSRTSGGAGYRQSSSCRSIPAGHATGTQSGSGRRSRSSPAADHSTGAPAADAGAAAAPAAPIPHH